MGKVEIVIQMHECIDEDILSDFLQEQKAEVQHMVKISVILPVYNEEKYLKQCVDSIRCQTLQEIEIICVDDGSTDSSLQILRDYAEQDSRIKVLTQENRFAGVARNHGMRYAQGKYLSFLDSDDYFEEDMLEKMYARAESMEADIVICRYAEHCEESGALRLPGWSFEDLFFKRKDIFCGASLYCGGIFQITKGWAWDKLFRTDFVKQCGYVFPDFRSSEDGFFVYMLLARAQRISYMDDILAIHRINNACSLSNTKERNWMNGFVMWQMIGQELKKQGIYEVYKQSFLNELSFFFVWYLDSMNTQEVYQQCLEYIRNEIEPEFQILDCGKDYFFQEEVWEWYREAVNG